MIYMSKKYVKEKWEPLKHDMELLLQGEDDQIAEEDYARVVDNLRDKFFAIMEELVI